MIIKKCQHEVINFSMEDMGQDKILAVLGQYLKADAKIAAWFNNKVLFGRYANGEIVWAACGEFDAKQFLELRAFNLGEELYLCGKRGRYIFDTDGEGIEYVDSFSRIWGDKATCVDGFVMLEDEGRKLRLSVPADTASAQELWLRSYIGQVKETGQASYTAWRYLDIVSKGERQNERQ